MRSGPAWHLRNPVDWKNRAHPWWQCWPGWWPRSGPYGPVRRRPARRGYFHDRRKVTTQWLKLKGMFGTWRSRFYPKSQNNTVGAVSAAIGQHQVEGPSRLRAALTGGSGHFFGSEKRGFCGYLQFSARNFLASATRLTRSSSSMRTVSPASFL